jgi:hypothetical protein
VFLDDRAYSNEFLKLKICTATLAAVLSAAAAIAQTASSPNKGKDVINRAIQALGGDRFRNLQNVVSSGRGYGFFHDQLSGLELEKSYTHYLSDGSSGLHVEQRIFGGKKQDYSVLYLPQAGYDLTFRGIRPLPDEQWNRYRRSTRNNFLYIARTRLNEPGMQFDYIGTDVYVSTHVEIVDITDSSDQVVRVYFDHNTGLPIHETYSWFDQETKEHNDEAVEFDKYRDAGGVMWPFSIERETNGYKVSQFFADKVEVDQNLPKGVFELPTGMKMLKKSN